MTMYQDRIRQYLEVEIEILRKISVEQLNTVLNVLEDAYENQKYIYIFGNGGSAATASHYTNDFNKGISEYTKKKFRFICLNDNLPTITAIANDLTYDQIFDFQLCGRLHPGDVVIGISGSGNSKNIVRAIEYANQVGATTIGITGYSGGAVKQISQISLHVPVSNMQIAEDIHMIFDHLMMTVLSDELINREKGME